MADESVYLVVQTGSGEELERLQIWPVTGEGVQSAFDLQDHITAIVRRMQRRHIAAFMDQSASEKGNGGAT